MNQLADYELNIISLMIRHNLGRDVAPGEIRAALMPLYSRPQTLAELAKATGLAEKTLYRRAQRNGIHPVGKDGSGRLLYRPSDIQQVAAITTGADAK